MPNGGAVRVARHWITPSEELEMKMADPKERAV
jgi:hypothetical protein